LQTLSDFSDASDSAEHIVFLHANGFPPDAYASFLSAISSLARISTIEHRPLWTKEAPKFLDWGVYADDAIKTLERETTRPVWLVGHSMGGAISLLIARKAPHLVKGLVGLDPVTINSRFLAFSRLVFRLWPDKPKMIRGALGRPHRFDSHQAAFEFYRTKRAFSGIADKELMDYVLAAHAPSESGVDLRYSGDWEACVYRSPPNLWRCFDRIHKPVHILGGEQSYVIVPNVAERLAQLRNVKFESIDAGHLMPMEKPQETASFVTECISRYET
jgi:pimeloyl-ACP methyl ester carboxylesterase